MAFIPVALNYDRMLEDQVLIPAVGASERCFNTSISLVTRSILRLVWLWGTGRYHRSGYAAASFGAPLSLRAHLDATGEVSAETLGRDLMKHIGEIVPVLPVPIVAWLILKNGPMTRADIGQEMGRLIDDLPQAHVHIPRDSRAYAVEIGLRNLLNRSVLALNGDFYSPGDAHAETLRFYANSIRHLMPPEDPPDSATAKQLSAPAGS